MSWLNDFVRPKLKKWVLRRSVPDNLWHKCPSCEQILFHRDLATAHQVCSHCQHHFFLPPKDRFDLIFDHQKYHLLELPSTSDDPLKFRDSKRYVDRLKEARKKSQQQDALCVAYGKVGGYPLMVVCFNFHFMGGSMGCAVGEGIVTAIQWALEHDYSLLIVPSSGGARMQEGILSLMQMSRITTALLQFSEKKLPYFVLLTHPTTGGVLASFSMLGDIHIAEPGATIGFAGRRVIESTIHEKMPDDFQTSEYLLDHGMVDMIVHRHELRHKMIIILRLILGDDRTNIDPNDQKDISENSLFANLEKADESPK